MRDDDVRASSGVLTGSASRCGSSGSDQPPEEVREESLSATRPAPTELEAQPWVLVSGVPGPEDVTVRRPSALFENGEVSGSTGCNRFTASYSADNGEIALGPVASTLMACPPPADAVERAYVAALAHVARWSVENEQLVLADAEGAELLRYDPARIEGTWTATGIRRGDGLTSPLAGTELIARFEHDGSLAGAAGCNTYRASFTTDRAGIAIIPPASTRKTCAQPEGVMEQEAAFLALLPQAVSHRLDADTLELSDAEGERLAAFVRKTAV